jgi:hypothetical protein
MQMSIRRLLSKSITSSYAQCLIVAASLSYSLPCNAENCTAAPVTGKVDSILNQASGMALDISHDSHALGVNAIQWLYEESSNWQFLLTDLGNRFLVLAGGS